MAAADAWVWDRHEQHEQEQVVQLCQHAAVAMHAVELEAVTAAWLYVSAPVCSTSYYAMHSGAKDSWMLSGSRVCRHCHDTMLF